MIIGIDLGGMSAKAACLFGTELRGKARVATAAGDPVEQTIRSLATLCMEAATSAGVDFEEVTAIGIGSPGIIDSETGTVKLWTNFGWRDVPLGESLSKLTGKRVYVTNDANAAALGEAKYGAGAKYHDSILITLGTGVGGGIIIDGKLFEGFKSAGAEIGHMVIRQKGKLCSCGRRGCFETYASARALIEFTEKALRENPGSLIRNYVDSNGKASGMTVFQARRAGDKIAEAVFDDYIAALGEGIVNLVNLFRPQAILIGGGLSAEGEYLLAPLRDYVYKQLYITPDYAPLEIVKASLGNEAGLFGAAEYARTREE